MGWKTFTDRLALILVFIIPALWVSQKWLNMPGEIIGATIMGWTLTLQFYLRKKEPQPPSGSNNTPPV